MVPNCSKYAINAKNGKKFGNTRVLIKALYVRNGRRQQHLYQSNVLRKLLHVVDVRIWIVACIAAIRSIRIESIRIVSRLFCSWAYRIELRSTIRYKKIIVPANNLFDTLLCVYCVVTVSDKLQLQPTILAYRSRGLYVYFLCIALFGVIYRGFVLCILLIDACFAWFLLSSLFDTLLMYVFVS